MLSSPDGASSYPQKTTTRDAVPLPDAARRIIRNQRGGGSPGMARHVQTLQKENLMPVRPSRRAINPQVARAHGSLGSSHRAPTLQEMYNTWRALEEQIDKMRRLPMFIKAERKFCHACRILKIRCECFDYSQLEAAYLEKDTILKHTALHELPFEDDDAGGHDDAAVESHSSRPPGSSPKNSTRQTPPTGGRPGPDGMQWAPLEACPPMVRDMSDYGHPVNDGHATASHKGQQTPDFDFNTAVAASMKLVTRSTADSTGVPLQHDALSPKLVKFEIRPVVIAKEKIGAHTRRWRCQFGSLGKPGDPVCTREDDNMETIRRHYGREHGRHRYHKKPTIRTRCSACSFDIDKQRPPSKCPGCKVVRGIWLREMSAQIEVPVPLHTGSQNGRRSSGGSAGGGGSGGNRSVDSPTDTASSSDMPACYSDICNNTTALPVMPPPSIILPASNGSSATRPASSSSSASSSRTLTPVTGLGVSSSSQYPQGFFTTMDPPATNRMAYPLTPLSPIMPVSSPSSNASSAYDAEAMALYPYDHQHLGVAAAADISSSSQARFADQLIMAGMAFDGGHGISGARGAGNCEATSSSTTAADYAGLYSMASVGPHGPMASGGMQEQPHLPRAVNLADIQLQQMFMDLAGPPAMHSSSGEMQTATGTGKSPADFFGYVE